MFDNIKLTEKTPKELENENEVLRKLLQEYVAQVELMKKIYNESALAWQTAHQELADRHEVLSQKLLQLEAPISDQK